MTPLCFPRARTKVHYRASVAARNLRVMDQQSLRVWISRETRRLTRSDALRGAAWRAFAERQACLAMLGHEMLAENRASYAVEPGGAVTKAAPSAI